MDEEEFDSLTRLRPFGREDAMRVDAQWRRIATLGQALWGRTSDDLQRQLLARYPDIPPNFDLADFRRLQQSAHKISAALGGPRFAWMSPLSRSSSILVGTQRFTAWEARCEIVRRAIEYLENPRRT